MHAHTLNAATAAKGSALKNYSTEAAFNMPETPFFFFFKSPFRKSIFCIYSKKKQQRYYVDPGLAYKSN